MTGAPEDGAIVIEHPLLARSASGLRHLRWTREVLGTLQAFAEHGELLSEVHQAALAAEIERVGGLVARLSGAVKPYRDFLERVRTRARGKVRAADFLIADGRGFGTPSWLGLVGHGLGARAIRDAAMAEMSAVIEPERETLRATLSRAIDEARDGLTAMDRELTQVFSAELVAALYPALGPDGQRVLDDGDPDDDAASGPASRR